MVYVPIITIFTIMSIIIVNSRIYSPIFTVIIAVFSGFGLCSSDLTLNEHGEHKNRGTLCGEDVRALFERKHDATICIPTLIDIDPKA